MLYVLGDVKEPFDLLLAQDIGDLFDSGSRWNFKGGLIPMQDMPIEAENAAEDVVHRSPGELFLFDEIEEVGLNLFLGKSVR